MKNESTLTLKASQHSPILPAPANSGNRSFTTRPVYLIGPTSIAVDGVGNAYVVGHISNNAFKLAPDCNLNDIPDDTDIENGTNLDCNLNLFLDVCDTIELGDFDVDGTVELDDYSAFTNCIADPDQSPQPSIIECSIACLRAFDLDDDNDVDLIDFAQFQNLYTISP